MDSPNSNTKKLIFGLTIVLVTLFALVSFFKQGKGPVEPLATIQPPPATEPPADPELNPVLAEVVTLAWATEAREQSTLVLTSTTPTYVALMQKKADGKVELINKMAFVAPDKEQRYSLGKLASEGVICNLAAPSPALLEKLLSDFTAGSLAPKESQCIPPAIIAE